MCQSSALRRTSAIMKIKHIVYALLIIGLVGLIAYRILGNSESEKSKSDAPKKPPVVAGMILQPQPFDNSLSLSGSLEANEQIELRSEVSGVVESINFNEGSKVSKGQVLFA